MNKDKKVMGTNIIILNNKHFRSNQTQKTLDDVYTSMVSKPEHLKKYWSHVCPRVGLVGLMDSVCPRCLKTKPKKEG